MMDGEFSGNGAATDVSRSTNLEQISPKLNISKIYFISIKMCNINNK